MQGIEDRVRHESEDVMEGDCADEGETVDIAKMYLTTEEQEGTEKEEEEDGTEQVGVIHNVLVDARHGIKNCEGLDEF